MFRQGYSPAFVSQVQDVLQAFYNPSELLRNPFIGLFDLESEREPAGALRRIFREAVRSLKTEENAPRHSTAWRVYYVLNSRYIEQLSQKEVAARMGVSEQTVSRWSQAENWDQLRVSITITREEQLRNLYRQLSEINKAIAERDQKFATSTEADTISKLATAIEKMESDVGISDIVSVSKKFLNWIRKNDLVKAQEFVPLFDAFIKDNLR